MDYVEVMQVLTFGGETEKWMLVVNGFQVGGEIDASGAGNMTFASPLDAMAWWEANRAAH